MTKKNVFYFYSSACQNIEWRICEFLSVLRGRNRLALSFRGICFLTSRSYIEGTMTNSITKRFIDNFGRVGPHHKTESNKIPEPCAFLVCITVHAGSSDAPSDIVARGNDDRGRTSTENGKGRDGERSSEWMARYWYEKYRLYHRVRLHHPPFCLLPTPFYSYAPSTAHLVDRTHRMCARAPV